MALTFSYDNIFQSNIGVNRNLNCLFIVWFEHVYNELFRYYFITKFFLLY